MAKVLAINQTECARLAARVDELAAKVNTQRAKLASISAECERHADDSEFFELRLREEQTLAQLRKLETALVREQEALAALQFEQQARDELKQAEDDFRDASLKYEVANAEYRNLRQRYTQLPAEIQAAFFHQNNALEQLNRVKDRLRTLEANQEKQLCEMT